MDPLEIEEDTSKQVIKGDGHFQDNDTDDDDGDDDDDSYTFENLLPPSTLKLYAGKNGKERKAHIDDDLDELLGIDMDAIKLKKELDRKNREKKKKMQQLKQSRNSCCGKNSKRRLGRVFIICPSIYMRFRCCVIGPHWFGVIFTVALLHTATYFFTKMAYKNIGVTSAAICIAFHVVSTVSLLLVSCTDPGIVRKRTMRSRAGKNDAHEYEGLVENDEYGDDDDDDDECRGPEEGWRYCAICDVHQPPTAAHCPDCQVCVDGYDHHCPWMGICIGKRNMKAFMTFNVVWLLYFFYATIWVVFLGESVMHTVDKHEE